MNFELIGLWLSQIFLSVGTSCKFKSPGFKDFSTCLMDGVSMDRNQPGVQDSSVSVFVLIRYHWAYVACGLKPAQQPRAEDSTMSVFVLPNFNRVIEGFCLWTRTSSKTGNPGFQVVGSCRGVMDLNQLENRNPGLGFGYSS